MKRYDENGPFLITKEVGAGLTLLDAGGDFADNIMAYGSKWLGSEAFISFDRQAIKLLSEQGETAQLLA